MCRTVGLSPGVAQALHPDEIPIDAEFVRRLVRRAMPAYVDWPVRPLASNGSTNALFRLGEELLARLPRQPGGSATILKEATWLPVLKPLIPVSVPDVVAVFGPEHDYPESWSVVRWIEGAHPEMVDPDTPTDPRREDLAAECVWADAMTLPGTAGQVSPRWYHGDLAAENLLMRDGGLSAVLDFTAALLGPSCQWLRRHTPRRFARAVPRQAGLIRVAARPSGPRLA